MNLVKWDPFRELEGIQTRLNHLFSDTPRAVDDDHFFANLDAGCRHSGNREGIHRQGRSSLIVKKEDVKVEIDDDVLTVEGERRQEKEEKTKRFHRTERAYGKFVRRFSLPTRVDGTNVKAEFKDGVLNVRLPKAETSKSKAIEIQVA